MFHLFFLVKSGFLGQCLNIFFSLSFDYPFPFKLININRQYFISLPFFNIDLFFLLYIKCMHNCAVLVSVISKSSLGDSQNLTLTTVPIIQMHDMELYGVYLH